MKNSGSVRALINNVDRFMQRRRPGIKKSSQPAIVQSERCRALVGLIYLATIGRVLSDMTNDAARWKKCSSNQSRHILLDAPRRDQNAQAYASFPFAQFDRMLMTFRTAPIRFAFREREWWQPIRIRCHRTQISRSLIMTRRLMTHNVWASRIEPQNR